MSSILTIFIIVVLAFIAIYYFLKKSPKKDVKIKEESVKEAKVKKTSKGANSSKKTDLPKLLVHELKGHSKSVSCVQFSQDGVWLGTSSDDRTVHLFRAKYFGNNNALAHQFARLNMPLDNPSCLCFGSTGKTLLCSLGNSRAITAFKVNISEKRAKGEKIASEVTSLQTEHVNAISHMGIFPGSYIVTMNDEELHIYGLSGRLLEKIEVNQLRNNVLAVCPARNLFTVGAFTGDVKIWTCEFVKGTEDFNATKLAMHLSGHKAAVRGVAFAKSRLATCSKDSTWRLWNIDVEWERGADAKCLCTTTSALGPLDHISIDPDGSQVVVVAGSNMEWYSADGALLHSVNDAHSNTITCVDWSSCGKWIATSCMDGVVRVWSRASN